METNSRYLVVIHTTEVDRGGVNCFVEMARADSIKLGAIYEIPYAVSDSSGGNTWLK